MSNFDVISKLYYKSLGKSLCKRMSIENVKITDFGYDDTYDTVFSSDTTIRGILVGKRNLTTKSVKFFLQTLNYDTIQQMYFPSEDFCLQIIKDILKLVVYSSHFNETIFKQTMLRHFSDTKAIDDSINQYIIKNQQILLKSFLDVIPKEKKEFSSKEISTLICDWLVDLACIISQK